MKLRNKEVLVTGADGFIGSHLVEQLIKNGARVKAVSYYNSFNRWGWLDTLPAATLKKIEVFTGDIRDPNGVLEAMKGCQVVFHLAALIGIPFSYHSPDCYVDTNIKGTLNVLQAARKMGVKKIIHTSTSEIYGTAQYVPIDELHPVNPQSPYAATKSGADELALSFYRSFNLPIAIARPFNTYGPRQSARAIIPTILAQVHARKKTIALGSINVTRDFNYVSDSVNGFIQIAESDKTNGQVFNVGSGRETSISELLDIVREVTKIKFRIVLDNQRIRPEKSEVERLVCDADRLKKVCGWKPQVSLEQGVKLTSQWIQKNLNQFKTDLYNI